MERVTQTAAGVICKLYEYRCVNDVQMLVLFCFFKVNIYSRRSHAGEGHSLTCRPTGLFWKALLNSMLPTMVNDNITED